MRRKIEREETVVREKEWSEKKLLNERKKRVARRKKMRGKKLLNERKERVARGEEWGGGESYLMKEKRE